MFEVKSPNARPGRRASLVAVALATLVTLMPFAAQADTPAFTRPEIPTASGPVHDIPVGGALPSDATCAARVIPTAENRPENVPFNNTRGVSANDVNPRVTGNFVGTTDEIIQWAACKWGLDVTWARHQAAIESWWRQNDVLGDFGTDPAACLPGHPIGADGRPGECPQSIGLLQVRFQYHLSAFENNNAIRSTAYNADYAWSIWRGCFQGEYTWLNDVERGRQYAAGDGLGCMGMWFAGRWYTGPAIDYMNRLSTAGAGIPTPGPSTTKPSAPTGLRAFVGSTYGVGSGQVLLGWNLPTFTGGRAVTDYAIQRSSDGGRTWRTTSDGVSRNRSYVASGLTNGHTYLFRVVAYTSAGWGSVSAAVSATPRAGPPSPPTGFTASVAPTPGVGSGQVLLSWNLPTSTGGRVVTDYRIARSSDGGVTWRIYGDGVTKRRWYLASGLANGHAYQFKVAAYTSAGWGPYTGPRGAAPRAAASLAAVIEIETTTTTTVAATTTTTSAPTTTAGPTTTIVEGTTTTTSSAPTTAAPTTAAPTTAAPTTIAPTTAAPTTAAPTTAAPTTAAPTTVPPTEAPTTAAPAVPPVQAPNCPAVTSDDEQRVNNALASAGLTIAVATAGDDGSTRYIVGSIYDSAGARVSNADTWVVINGELLALSEGANQYSEGLNDARAVLTEPSQVQIDLATCATAAL